MATKSSIAGSSAMVRFRTAGLTLMQKLAKFGVVGAFAYLIDIGLFNILCYGGSQPILAGQPFLAKVASTIVATVAAWLGNRYWTFRRTRRKNARREFVLYIAMCTIGLGISLGCLWISHKVLGLTSPLADNISANIIGLGAATAFRFWSYQRFVFTAQHSEDSRQGGLVGEITISTASLGKDRAALNEG